MTTSVPRAASYIQYRFDKYPRQIRIETSSACSMKCVMCHGHGGRNPLTPEAKKMSRPMERMDPKIAFALVDEIATWPVPLYELVPTNYGELFLFPQWDELCQAIDQKLPKTRIALATTGTLVSDPVLMKLAQVKTLKYLNVSVNAFFAETYERIHGVPASHLPRIEAWIKKFRAMRGDVHVQVSMAYDPLLQGQSEMERDLFKMHWGPIVNEVSINTTSYVNHPMRGKPVFPIVTPCRSVFDGLTVFSNGKIGTGCCFDADAELVVGEYPRDRLLDVWNGQALRELGKIHNEGRRQEIDICRDCTFA